jgi:hypothetical protein
LFNPEPEATAAGESSWQIQGVVTTGDNESRSSAELCNSLSVSSFTFPDLQVI